jgi:hypothetical protein
MRKNIFRATNLRLCINIRLLSAPVSIVREGFPLSCTLNAYHNRLTGRALEVTFQLEWFVYMYVRLSESARMYTLVSRRSV